MCFRHDSTYTMHIRTKHDHIRPFFCEKCDKSFGRLSHLRKHQKLVCLKENNDDNINKTSNIDNQNNSNDEFDKKNQKITVLTYIF